MKDDSTSRPSTKLNPSKIMSRIIVTPLTFLTTERIPHSLLLLCKVHTALTILWLPHPKGHLEQEIEQTGKVSKKGTFCPFQCWPIYLLPQPLP